MTITFQSGYVETNCFDITLVFKFDVKLYLSKGAALSLGNYSYDASCPHSY